MKPANQIKFIEDMLKLAEVLCILHFQAAKAGGAGGLGAFVPAVVVLGLAIAAYFFLNNNA